MSYVGGLTRVLYMSFDKFILAVESRDLCQADKSIIRVSSFPKLRISSRTYFSVSQQLRPELSAKWMLSILSNLPLTRKTEKNVYFSILQIKLTKTSILPNYQVPNSFFDKTVNFIIRKLKFCKIEKEVTLIILLSAWHRSRDSTAKRNLSKDI